MTHLRILFALLLAPLSAMSADPPSAKAATRLEPRSIAAPASIEAFFQSYCYTCHDAATAKADLDLEGLTRRITNSTDALHWQDILDQLNAGEMPPKKKRQPTKDELIRVVGDLTESLQSAQTMLSENGAEIIPRRLNRREYVATIKELMGVSIDGGGLPDDSGGRFDTIGANQSLSAMQLERYFSFAQEVSRMALHWASQPRDEAKVTHHRAANRVNLGKSVHEALEKIKIVHETDKPWSEVGLTEYEWITYNPGTAKYPRHAEYRDRTGDAKNYADNLPYHDLGYMLSMRTAGSGVGAYFPHDARAHYRLRVQAGVRDGITVRRVIRMTVAYRDTGLNGAHGKPIGSFLVSGSLDKPSTHEMVWHPSFSPDFRPETPKKSASSVVFMEDKRGGPGVGQEYPHYRPIEPGAPLETILVKWTEAEGPFYDPKTVFELLADKFDLAKGKDEDLDKIVPEFLSQFATAAFRGQAVSDEWLQRLQTYYRTQRDAGKGFKDAIIDPLAMILCSPRFLYLLEPAASENEKSRELDAISLANRLSYFLWSGPPDEELFRLAESGALRQEAVLAQQVDRMLAHPRAEHFYEGFMSQWTHLKRFDEVGLSSRLLLHRTDAMILAAKSEPVEFFKALAQENLPVANLIDSKFALVNGVLALKYGLANHYSGDGFQKVMLPPDSPRGGLLTQSALLTIGTMNNRTSPVIRGSLVKDILLNDPPPPPPPNVPELIAAATEPLPSVRSLVELHQQKAQCASCHARFDFIGLGLETFDPVGMWRDEELVTEAQEAGQIPRLPKKIYPIDASGRLPGGESFKDLRGLKAALMKEERKVAESLFEGLFCYALGRNASFTDRPVIGKALDDLATEKFPVRRMISKVVTSAPFLQK